MPQILRFSLHMMIERYTSARGIKMNSCDSWGRVPRGHSRVFQSNWQNLDEKDYFH